MKEYHLHKRWRRLESPSLISVLIINTAIVLTMFVVCIMFVRGELQQSYEETEKATSELSDEIYQLKCMIDEVQDEMQPEETIETSVLEETQNISNIHDYEYNAEDSLQVAQRLVLTEYIDIWDYTSNDITNITNASEEEFNEMVSDIMEYRETKNSSMLNIGGSLVKVEQNYGISGTAILSIITWESDFGDDCINTNNVGGIRIDNKYVSFDSVNECILYMGELLHTYVHSHELTSWEDIGERYCDYTWSEKIPETLSSYNEDLNKIMYKNITGESIS